MKNLIALAVAVLLLAGSVEAGTLVYLDKSKDEAKFENELQFIQIVVEAFASDEIKNMVPDKKTGARFAYIIMGDENADYSALKLICTRPEILTINEATPTFFHKSLMEAIDSAEYKEMFTQLGLGNVFGVEIDLDKSDIVAVYRFTRIPGQNTRGIPEKIVNAKGAGKFEILK